MAKHEEDRLQIAVMDYIKYQYPFAIAIHPANERKTSPIAGARLKRKGVVPGVSDILIFNSSGHFNGLAIELKIKPNTISIYQEKFMQSICDLGWKVKVCYDFDEAKKTIDAHFKK